jgi:hypothetical protein
MDGETVVLSFVGTLIALLITKTVERAYTKTVEEAELSRDLILQLADTLVTIERFVLPLSQPCDLHDTTTLRSIPSSYEWSSLPLKLEKLLQVFSDPEIHRLLYRFFNRDELHRAASKEHERAYFWLLDEAEIWTDDRATERLLAIATCRSRMLAYTRDMLRDGYRLIECLYPRANNVLANLLRGESAEFYRYLKESHGLTVESIGARRAYFSGRVEAPFRLEGGAK